MKSPAFWLYAAACVLVPVLWGVLVVWVMDRVERSLRRRGRAEIPPPEYHI